MGIYEELRAEMAQRTRPPARVEAPTFSGVVVDPGTLYGVQSVDQLPALGTVRVTRREAMAIPAVKQGRDIICRAGAMPLQMLDAANRVVPRSLLAQPEDGRSSVSTWSQVIEDLMLSPAAWLAITAVGWDTRPATVVRLDPATVTYQQRVRTYTTATGQGTVQAYDPDPFVIRIDAPSDPLLTAGARAIRALGRLELAALRAAEGVPPQDWFTPAGDVDPDEDDVQALLNAWLTARAERATAYVPAALAYHRDTFDADKAQLAEARQHGVLEIARLLGLDPEDLGVSTTSRSYSNQQDRRRDRLDFTMGLYTSAIEARLSMNDVTPAGYTVRFDPAALSAANDLTRAQTDVALVGAGIKTRDEVRAERGLQPLATTPAPQETP